MVVFKSYFNEVFRQVVIMNTAQHNDDSRKNNLVTTDQELSQSNQTELKLLPVAVEFIRRIMPSEEAYRERVSLYPDTYGNPKWVEKRIADCSDGLTQPMWPRSDRAALLFNLLGISADNMDASGSPTTLQAVLEKFTSPSEVHRAISACIAVASNLMSGYTRMEDWDGVVAELIKVPEQQYSKFELEYPNQIALIYEGSKDSLSDAPVEFITETSDSIIVDLESLRLDVLLNFKNSLGMSSLLKAGAQPLDELQSLLHSCVMLRHIKSTDRDSIPLLPPVDEFEG